MIFRKWAIKRKSRRSGWVDKTVSGPRHLRRRWHFDYRFSSLTISAEALMRESLFSLFCLSLRSTGAPPPPSLTQGASPAAGTDFSPVGGSERDITLRLDTKWKKVENWSYVILSVSQFYLLLFCECLQLIGSLSHYQICCKRLTMFFSFLNPQ